MRPEAHWAVNRRWERKWSSIACGRSRQPAMAMTRRESRAKKPLAPSRTWNSALQR